MITNNKFILIKYTLIIFISLLLHNLFAQSSKYVSIEIWKNNVHKTIYDSSIDSITISPTPLKITDPYNGHAYMDMNLPSGTLWATCNVGAENPTDIGLYISWAELEEKENYDWDNTKYFDGEWLKQTKYCTNSNHGKVDSITELECEDDIAFNKWGINWRIPSEEDFKELLAFCNFEWDINIPGFVVTANNGNRLVFPVTGYKYRDGLESNNVYDSEISAKGVYWTRDLVSYASEKAWAYVFSGWEVEGFTAPSYTSDKYKRCYGCNIRPVSYLPEKEDSNVGYIYFWDKGNSVKFALEQIDSICFRFLENNDVYNYNGYEYVDLGLPSGVMWASCNIGADSIKGHGDYFAWGETLPKEEYTWKTYKLGNSKGPLEGLQLIRYCLDEQYGEVDNLYELNAQDDAAHIIWGEGWRTPSLYDLYELIRYCKKTEIRNSSRVLTLQGLPDGSGVLYTGPNGNSIFLPAAGYKMGKRVTWLNEFMSYWLNQLMSSSNATYYYDSFGTTALDSKDRCYGMPIRPVVDFIKGGNIGFTKDISTNDCIFVSVRNGNGKQFLISKKPTIKYSKDIINVNSLDISMYYALSDNIRIQFGNTINSNVKTVINNKTTISNDGNNIIVSGIEDNSRVTLYDISGRKISTATSNNGKTILNASKNIGNIYIIKIGETVIKYLMK
jgi:hypothetical protein